MRGLFTSIVFFYWLMGQIQVYAQTPPTTTLTGRVTDVTTGKEMPFANVFINNTTRGTSTDENGQYRLTQVPIGTVEVVASFVGYAPTRQFIRLGTDPSYTVNIQLKTDDSMLKGVTITAKRSKAWERQFRRFRDALLGDSPFMNQCLIPQ